MVNDKAIMAIASILSGLAGFVGGALVRQPEINKLHKMVKKLQEDVDILEQRITEQDNDIAAMLVEYEALKIFQFSRRKEMKSDIQESLILQYAAVDYLQLLVDYAHADIQMTKEDVQFYKAYGKLISGKLVDFKEKECIKSYVMQHHASDIERLKACDSSRVLEEIRQYGSSTKALLDTGHEEPKKKRLFGKKKKDEQDE